MASKNKNSLSMVGGYAFIVGVLLSIVLGLMGSPQAWMLAVLAVLGLVVAFLNISKDEVHGYLLANVAVIVGAGAFGQMLSILAIPLNLGNVAAILQSITGNLVFFVAPGAVVIALKEIYHMAREG